jgi:predicted small lipoprotein YifL
MRRSALLVLLAALVMLPGCKKGGKGPYFAPAPVSAPAR